MTPLSPATLVAIQSKDYVTIMARLCDPERGPEQQYLYDCYKKLNILFSNDEQIMESGSDSLYDFQNPNIQPSQRLLDFIAFATGKSVLDISEFSNPDDLLTISFLLPEMEVLSFSSCVTVRLDRFLTAFPKLTDIAIDFCPIVLPERYLLPLLPLENVRFNGSSLSRLPSGIENLRQLRSFSCLNNHLTEFPEELTSLSLLWKLELQNNHVAGAVPENIGKMTTLKSLNLANNQLQDIQHLAQLPKLSFLNIEDNKVLDIRALEQLPELSTLLIGGNPLSTLPRELAALNYLSIDADQFHLMCDLLPKCPQLKTLFILRGTIPVDLGILKFNTQLQDLDIRFVNVISLETISNLYRLEKLCLRRTHLQTDLSPIFSLSKLKELNLDDNDLPELPDRFAELPNLETIHLGGNRFHELPPSLLRHRARRWGGT